MYGFLFSYDERGVLLYPQIDMIGLYKSAHTGLVQKEVSVTREGTTFMRRQWVRPDEAESTQKFTKEQLAKMYADFISNSVDGHTFACKYLKESGFQWEESSSSSENWKCAKTALEHTIDIVFFPNGDKTISSGGQNKFNIEIAKKEYLKCLTNVPQKNKIFLEYYAKNTEYVLNTGLPGAFAYSMKKDVIFYNPSHQEFGMYGFEIVNTHELAHRIDALNLKSWNNKIFRKTIADTIKMVNDNFNKFNLMAKNSNVCQNIFLGDILSALSYNKLDSCTGHSQDIWEVPNTKESEIFANLFSLESLDYADQIKFVKKYFLGLYEAYFDFFRSD